MKKTSWILDMDTMYDRAVELWREIPGYPGNEGSTFGNLRTYWYRVRNKKGRGSHRERWETPRSLPASPKEDGRLHTNIYCEPKGKRFTRNVQTLIAHTFIPKPDDFDEVDYTVDHIKPGPEGKLDNSVWNLQWMSRADNIKKAYREGMCDDRIARQRVPIIAYDSWIDKRRYYHSATEAAKDLGLVTSTIAHSIDKDRLVAKRYQFEYAGREDKLLYEHDDLQFIPWV